MKILDFSAGPPNAQAIKAAGADGVMLYLSPGREPWMTGKAPSRAFLDSLDSEGIKYGFVWQFRAGGSIDSGDAGRGYDGGYSDASAALAKLNELQCFAFPVHFAVDWDVTLPEWNSRVADYFRGAVAKLGLGRVGIYGHSRLIAWAKEDGLVAEVAPGRVLGWQTKSWSNGVEASDYATLYQHTHNVPGPDGVQVDINEPFFEDWGWRGVPDQRVRPASTPVQITGVEYPCDVVIDAPDSGWRDPYSTQATVFHTTENSDNALPENVAKWQSDPANQSSYNVLIGADVTGAKTVRTNPDDRRPWAAGEPGNTQAIHVSGVGYASRSRQDWINNPKQLERFAEVSADHHLRYGRPLVWLEPADVAAGREGFTSHGNWYLGKGGPAFRSDPGENFPHDIVLARAKELVTQGEDMSFTDADRKKLDEVHAELTKRFPSRSDFRATDSPVDTLAGFVLNVDAREHENAVFSAAQRTGLTVDQVVEQLSAGKTFAEIGADHDK
ncbi:DUF1906 domain-containing protein [Corynebacterium callunae]|uniref:glycoside hydrolase domain-containing protein n=1 Tax=Corynebacterium callunae TaxID=1721 RepID=UPI003982C82D